VESGFFYLTVGVETMSGAANKHAGDNKRL